MKTQFARTTTIGFLVCILAFSPMHAQAQTTDATYQPQTVEEMIAYLYGIIAQLQAQLDARTGGGSDSGNSSGSGSTVRPGGGNSRSLDVDTLSADDIRDDEADLRGRIDLNGNDYAYTWFEYGEDDDDLDDRTVRRRVTDTTGDRQSVRINLDDLDEDERYYYRLVGENESGDEFFGRIRDFRTDDDRRSSDRNSSNGDFELEVDDTSIDFGDTVEVDWEIPDEDVGTSNWIGLYREDADNRNMLMWTYLERDDRGTEEFQIQQRGEFEFRLFLRNTYEDVATSREVEVE